MVEREYIQSNLRTWKVKLLLLLYPINNWTIGNFISFNKISESSQL